MSRLIDADAFDVISTKAPDGVDADSYIAGIAYVVSKIDAQPTIEERKTGKWLPYLSEGLTVKCSECGSRFDRPWHHCPNCGASMTEGESS